jgi:hypothetical protein
MDSQDVIQAIDLILPDPKIFEDVNNMLKKYRASGQKKVQLEDEDISIAIPEGVQIDIVTKAFFNEYFDINLGTGYRVQVAMGGIQKQKRGRVYPELCFATLFYDATRKMLMIDFHQNMI